MAPPAAPPHTSAARRDLLALAALGGLTFVAARRFALFDRLVEAGRRLEGAGVDALIVTVLVLAFGLTVYAWRRWREARRELTARRRAEEALRASEARLRLLMRQLPAFLWTTDLELRLDSFAGGGFRRDGIDPRGRVGKTVAAFFGTADPAFPPLAAHRRALGGEPAEYPLQREGREYAVRVEPLRDAAGIIVGTLGLGVDVTERERSTAALRDSEARFRAIFEHAAIGIGLADLARRPLMVNPALARLTGCDGDGADEHGFGRATHPEDASRDDALFAELVAGRRDHYQLEKRYLRPDGTTAWGRLTTSLVRDAAGVPQYAIGMVEEITARMAAEGALRAREARYRAVVEQAAEGIFLFEAEGKRLVEANSAFLHLLGYSAADLPTLTLYDLVAHDRASVDANVAAIVADGQRSIGERDYRRKDGATVPVEVSATALRGDAGPLLCVVVRDLAARKAAAARLREGDRRLRAAVDHAPLILFTLDRAGVVTFARGQGLATLGLTPEQVLGRSVFVAGQEFPAVSDNVRRALAGETFDAAVAIGQHRFSVHYAPLGDDDGAIAGVIGVAANSTRRVRAEAAVRRYATGLTPREQEALALLATDLTQRQVAARLCVGHETVRSHLRRIAAKLGLDTAERAAVAVAAREQGLLEAASPES